MKKILFLFLVFLNFSCSNKDINLSGHWHITRIDGPKRNFESYQTLDVENDSTMVLGKYLGGRKGLLGFCNRQKRLITFTPNYSVGSFKFSVISENEIQLSPVDNQFKTTYLLTRISSFCCDRQLHLFQLLRADIDLPIISPNEKYDTRKEIALEYSIHVGIPKKEFQEYFGNSHQVLLGNKFSNINKLEMSEKKFMIQIPESKRMRAKRVIYADKNTPIKVIEEIVNFYHLRKITKLYLALRNENICEEVNIYLKDIHDFDSGHSNSVMEWLESEARK